MSYVFDNSPLSVLFRNYYRKTFKSLWHQFDEIVADGRLVSTREALREIEDGAPENLLEWAKENAGLFVMPTLAEGEFVAGIYRVAHFQQNIEQQKLLKGGRNADPFIIAKRPSRNARRGWMVGTRCDSKRLSKPVWSVSCGPRPPGSSIAGIICVTEAT